MVLKMNFPIRKTRVMLNISNKYTSLRQANFPKTRIVDKNWSANAECPHYGMSIEQNEDWSYHKSPTIRHNILDYKIFPKYRISLNCVADGNLFLALDEYFSRGTINGKIMRHGPVNGYYKTPRYGANYMWLTRTDPVTIYFMNEADKQTIEDIKEITRPYRNPINVPKTDKVFAQGQFKDAEWMSYSRESQPEELVQIIKRTEKINPILADGIHKYARGNGKSVRDANGEIIYLVKDDAHTQLIRISAGQYYAIKEYVDEYERLHSKLRIGHGLNPDR